MSPRSPIPATVSRRSMPDWKTSISLPSTATAARPEAAMFAKIARFEFRYQLSSPVFWVSFGIFFLLTFLAVVTPEIQIGSRGNTHVNAPFAIVEILQIFSVFAIFLMTAFVANVVVRDDDTGYGSIIRATPVTKFDYLFGRFAGAFVAGALAFASVPIAILIGTLMPWVDPMKVGAFHLNDYLYAYFVVAIPTLFLTGAIFFALATATRSMLATYVGVVAFLVLYFVMNALFSKPEFDHITGLLDPFALGAVQEATKYWTASDRNTLLVPLSGIMAENRAIWIGIAVVMLGVAFWLYRFQARASGTDRKSKDAAEAPRAASGPLPAPSFGAAATRTQFLRWTRFEMGQVFKSPAFFVLMALGALNSFGGLWYADHQADFTVYPVTHIMITTLFGAFAIIEFIVAIYYAGELVWRERDRRTHEMIDSTPVPDWVFVVPKIAAIALVLFSTFLIAVAVAIAVQTVKGYTQYELGHYLLWYILPETLSATLLAVLSIFVQALSPHKYVGWGVMALFLVATLTFNTIGFQDRLYLYNAMGQVPLSDMNGEGKFWIGRDWFAFYWSSCAVILAVLAYALWRRGSETRLAPRFRRLPHKLAGLPGVIVACAAVAMIGSGSFIFYNTHVLNEFRSTKGDDQFSADYEKALLKFQHVPQPRITDVTLDVSIYPHAPRVETVGIYKIMNRTGKPLAQMHIRWDRDLAMKSLAIDGAHLVKDYGAFHYRIYAFDTAMAPNETRLVHFDTVLQQKGFKNSGNTTRIVDNGTFVNNFEVTPGIGMDQSFGLLTDPVKRRRYGLPGELRPPKLEDDAARANNFIRHDSDWVNSDITVSTVADQIPIAPGYKVSETVADGRRTARFKSDSPILPFFSMQSAAYAVKHAKWHNVDIAIYYYPGHPYDVDRMIHALQAGFDVYTKAFGPYQFRQIRILEFPDYAGFAQSFANTIPYSESIGFIQDSKAVAKDPEKIDMVTYVTAHELGHQWWAHQVIGADMQGDTMLDETFAQYSAMLVMEHLYGPNQIRKFLKSELEQYLKARGGEEIEELPLERVENQGYIHYAKGAVIMYRLKDTVGEDVVDRSLRKLLAQYKFKPAPYPSSKDFIKILRHEAGPKYDALITDLFQKITIYDLKAVDAHYTTRADGKYDLALTVTAHKFYADGKGKETESPMNENVPIGAFLSKPGEKGFGDSKVIDYQRMAVHSGKQVIHLTLDKAPAFAGIDPYNEWIDRNSDDNILAASAG
jgi:aminopeptidase N